MTKSVKFERRGEKAYLISDKNTVSIPEHFIKLTEFVFNRELVSDKLILNEFKNMPEDQVNECIENLRNMRVLV